MSLSCPSPDDTRRRPLLDRPYSYLVESLQSRSLPLHQPTAKHRTSRATTSCSPRFPPAKRCFVAGQIGSTCCASVAVAVSLVDLCMSGRWTFGIQYHYLVLLMFNNITFSSSTLSHLGWFNFNFVCKEIKNPSGSPCYDLNPAQDHSLERRLALENLI
ncbi:hypothetical protein RRG08_057816 [Elysia crispata]|uniref:Uncharacterized protein n=1 Tax=Elysia crispata TaxID=231223 RepID=A0AAE1AYQ9_9GAST|nr:hypothetical protein RRG08_057816 [Elysia crispata]